MNSIAEYSKKQYEFVRGSRKVLFDYCQTISVEDFINETTSFGRGGSMRNLLVHTANTYQYWIANLALRINIPYSAYEDFKSIDSVIELFDSIDGFMFDFLGSMKAPEKDIEYKRGGVKNVVKPFKLFSHVITHEYHHKGQVLSISRHLGYVPLDTDIMR